MNEQDERQDPRTAGERRLDGQRVSVIGIGASGRAAARLALEQGGDVYVSEVRADPAAQAAGGGLRVLGADVELGRHDVDRIADSDTVVVSPGIPPNASVLEELRERGRPWISEAEFAYRFFAAPLIAVTGTNGKTTTAAWTAHLLESSGFDVGLGGNIGAAFGPAASELAMRDPVPDWFVVEVSSFQLADVERFTPDIGVLTNLAPDHLDRYESVEAYYSDKARLFERATEESHWVLPEGDVEVERMIEGRPGARHYVSAVAGSAGTPGPRRAAFLDDRTLTLDVEGREALVAVDDLPLLGRHNAANALFAAVTARLAGASADRIRDGLTSFPPLPHRLEALGEVGGVLWVNDSKATNVAAACGALTSLERTVVALLGGKDKGEDFTPLRDALGSGVRHAVLFGAARARLADTLDSGVDSGMLLPVDGGMDEAVSVARATARPGDVLLLSPGCSSFDEFSNYEARGERFRALFEEVR